jgi:type VI secretion system secreted protein VgrG
MIQTVFQEWAQRSPLFASSLSLDKSGLTKDYDVRPFIMQASESDFDFLTRLMRSEGINWLIDEAQLKVPSSTEQIQAQKLRLIDDNSQFSALERRNIRFHRSSAVEKRFNYQFYRSAFHSTDFSTYSTLASRCIGY